MSYRTRWLTKSDMTRIEHIEDLPHGTLVVDEDGNGKLDGAFASNALSKIRDPQLRSRADSGIDMFFESSSTKEKD